MMKNVVEARNPSIETGETIGVEGVVSLYLSNCKYANKAIFKTSFRI